MAHDWDPSRLVQQLEQEAILEGEHLPWWASLLCLFYAACVIAVAIAWWRLI